MYAPLIIGAREVIRCYMTKLHELTSILERAFVDFSAQNGNAVQSVRSSTRVSKHNGLLLTMPAYSKTQDSLITKLVTVYPGNAASDLSVVQSNVFLFNSKNGSLKCVVDGEALTALRTAHASAIATKHLSSGFDVLSILGAGTQARSHIQMFSSIFQFKEIRVWNHRPESARKLAAEMEEKGISVQVFPSVESAVQNADVIVTATISTSPILKSQWIKCGAHINAVGACDPDWQELDEELMRASTIYVDSREAALVESGDIIKSKVDIKAEIGEVIAGKVKAESKETTVFKSLGMAIEDAVTANAVYVEYVRNLPQEN